MACRGDRRDAGLRLDVVVHAARADVGVGVVRSAAALIIASVIVVHRSQRKACCRGGRGRCRRDLFRLALLLMEHSVGGNQLSGFGVTVAPDPRRLEPQLARGGLAPRNTRTSSFILFEYLSAPLVMRAETADAHDLLAIHVCA